MDRRAFCRASALAGLGALARPRRVAAADKLTVAHIGVGSMGNGHVSAFAGQPDTILAAVCDVDQRRLGEIHKRCQSLRPNDGTKAYTDFRRILERDDIDVITTATPDHWHALVAILSFQVGKDVYGEKPLAHNYREAQAMEATCQRYGRVFQLGTQIHAGDNYHRVVELVRSGRIGKIHTVRLFKTGGSPGMGYPPSQDPPAELDWEMWLGPAPYRPYVPGIHPHQFRHFWDFSGGVYADFWCHIADLPFWALELGAPRRIDARGEPPRDGIADTPQTIDVDFDYGDLKLEWRTAPPDHPDCRGWAIGAQFIGADGMITANYTDRVIRLGQATFTDLPDVPRALPRSPGHHRNFLDCVKSRDLTESNLAYARRLTSPMFLGGISFRLGRPLTWDAAAEQFVGDEAANRLLYRPYRAPWSLPA